MACTIGRITGLQSPDSIRPEGDSLQLSGEYSLDPAAGVRLAQRLRAYPSPDEPVVPFIYDATVAGGHLDGFYEIDKLDVDWAKLATGLFSWSATLNMVATGAAPLFEVLCKGRSRTTGSGATGGSWVAIPGSATAWRTNAVAWTSGGGVVNIDGGTVRMLSDDASDAFYDATVEYFVAPASCYEAAPRLELSFDSGATWLIWPGRQMPNLPTSWRITNDRVRVSNVAGALRAEIWDGTQWEACDFHAISAPGVTETSWVAANVIRNSPTAVSVQLTPSDSVSTLQHLTLTLRRGATIIEGRLAAWQANKIGLFRAASEAATAITGGIEATAAVAGNKYIILSPQAIDKDVTGTSGINLTANGSAIDFGFSAANTTPWHSGVTLTEHYFAAMRHTQRVVKR